MKRTTLPQVESPEKNTAGSALDEILRSGARRLFQKAIENEGHEYVQEFKEVKDEMNKWLVTRNDRLLKKRL